MDSVTLRPLKTSMGRDSDESRRLVEADQRISGRASGSLDDDEDLGDEVDDFIKGTATKSTSSG